MRLPTCSALLCAVLLACPLAAQEQRGGIQGIVKDTSGAVVPGVTVEARSSAGAVLSTVTDTSGVYRFPSVLPGVFDVNASLQGFKSEKLGNVQVALGQIKTVDFTLTPGGVTES